MRQKNITKTFRNGKAVFQMDFVVRLKPDIAGKEFHVTEQRAQYKDEKIVFVGRGKNAEKDAEKFYNENISSTVLGGSSALIR